MIGNPGLGDGIVLENAISRGIMSSKTVIDGMNYLQLSIAINPGNSGGPVFDSAGRVIGVATLKSSKAEAMGFCIPVEDIHAAMNRVGPPCPDLASRHRVEVAFKLLTVAGALYANGLDARAGIVRNVGPGGTNPNPVPDEQAGNLHETLTMLDHKLFSLIEGEISQLQDDPALSELTQRRYQELLSNYKAMKDLYAIASRGAGLVASQVQTLKAKHLRLVETLRNDLKINVPPRLLAALQPHSLGGSLRACSRKSCLLFFNPRSSALAPADPRRPNRTVPSRDLGSFPDGERPMQKMRDRMQDMQKRLQGMRLGPRQYFQANKIRREKTHRRDH